MPSIPSIPSGRRPRPGWPDSDPTLRVPSRLRFTTPEHDDASYAARSLQDESLVSNAPMSAEKLNPADSDASMKRIHWAALCLLGVCAGLILIAPSAEKQPPPDRLITTLSVGSALVAIVSRRLGSSPRITGRSARRWLIAALLAASCLGLLGTFEALYHGGTQTGLLFTLAGLIFAVRRPQ